MDKSQESPKVGEDNTNSPVKDQAPSAMGSETDLNRDQNQAIILADLKHTVWFLMRNSLVLTSRLVLPHL